MSSPPQYQATISAKLTFVSHCSIGCPRSVNLALQFYIMEILNARASTVFCTCLLLHSYADMEALSSQLERFVYGPLGSMLGVLLFWKLLQTPWFAAYGACPRKNEPRAATLKVYSVKARELPQASHCTCGSYLERAAPPHKSNMGQSRLWRFVGSTFLTRRLLPCAGCAAFDFA